MIRSLKKFGSSSKVKDLSYDSAVPLSYPKDLKTGTQTATCMPLFMAALFTIVKIQKHRSFYQQMNG